MSRFARNGPGLEEKTVFLNRLENALLTWMDRQ